MVCKETISILAVDNLPVCPEKVHREMPAEGNNMIRCSFRDLFISCNAFIFLFSPGMILSFIEKNENAAGLAMDLSRDNKLKRSWQKTAKGMDMEMKGSKTYTIITDLVYDIIGSFFYAVGIRRVAQEIDMSSFVMVTETNEVFGEGFLEHQDRTKNQFFSTLLYSVYTEFGILPPLFFLSYTFLSAALLLQQFFYLFCF